jgi:hypothetical protein
VRGAQPQVVHESPPGERGHRAKAESRSDPHGLTHRATQDQSVSYRAAERRTAFEAWSPTLGRVFLSLSRLEQLAFASPLDGFGSCRNT